MDQDNAEKRIADLERQQADAVGQPRHEPARSAKQGSPGKAGLGRRLFIGLLAALVPTIMSGVAMYNAYAYHAGTPTTATNILCTGTGRGRGCTGTWSLGGESHTGEVRGANRDGSSDVRVYGGIAFTADVVHYIFPLGAFMVGLITTTFVVGFNYQSLRARAAARRERIKP